MKSPRSTAWRHIIFVGVLMFAAGSALAQTNVTSVSPSFAIDFAGEWSVRNNEDPGQPPLGDYLGIPFNDAGRLRAETSAESIWGTVEFQCRPHSAPHQWRGVGGARILKQIDPQTRTLTAYHMEWWRSMRRAIYMDGRPHPPAWAPHSWTGFSTGEWIGDTLKVTTTHLKDGYLKRSGPQTSDMYTMTEYISRHGDLLTVFMIVDDPIYLAEPFVQSTTSRLDPTNQLNLELCSTSFAENGGTDRHWVPHYLPGQNTFLTEWLEDENWIPEAARGGAETIYPDYQLTLAGEQPTVPAPISNSAFTAVDKVRAQSPEDGQVHVLPVQGNVYMLVVDGTNIAASIGPDGSLLVNTGPEHMADEVIESIDNLSRSIAFAPRPNDCLGMSCSSNPDGWSSPYMNSVISSPAPPKPIRYIFNTNASPSVTGGNVAISEAGYYPRGGGNAGAVAGIGQNAMIISHENVLLQMSAPVGEIAPTPEESWPTDTFFEGFYKLSEYFNGEGVVAYHHPATTDGDSIVHFRRSEVIHAGDIYSTVSYPVIDIENGGSINGVIDGLNAILDLAMPENRSQGGTWVIPSHGRLSDTADVASYRNMVTMVRDRIRSMIRDGQNLDQILAANPTLDFDGRYGSDTGDWTTAMFIEAAYRSLGGE